MRADSVDLDRHGIELEFLEAVPKEVDAGADLTFTVRVRSSDEFDLSNAPFLITAAAGDVRLTGELPDFAGEEEDIARIALAAPEEIGEFAWNFLIPEHEKKGKVCPAASLPFSFRTRPHVTSLAAWDYPSPVVIGEKFRLKVGAQCSAACTSLQGEEIEIRDETDAVVASVPLSATPWPETNALYWAEVELTAPGVVGLHSWTVKFSSAQLHLPHGEATFSFSLITDRPPEHTVTVRVVEEQTQTPVDNAQVRLGFYRISTDQMGLARIAVPNGEHELFFWKAGYEAPPRTVEVKRDADIKIEVKVLPSVDPDSYWQG